MLLEEAKILAKMIFKMAPNHIFPMINIGSSNESYRKYKQPYINKYIFGPIQDNNYKVVHTDIGDGSGVDIVGDLMDHDFLVELSKMNFKSVFCTNLLEHVINIEALCKSIVSIIPVGGYIFLSCPYKYPFHLDPIDTMFRPNIDECAKLFPGTQICWGEIIKCGTYYQSLSSSPLLLLKFIARLLMPFYRPMRWYSIVLQIPWFFKEYEVTCVLLQKINNEK